MTFRIGIISDTHGLLRPEAERRLAGVDHIIHGGDIGRSEIDAIEEKLNAEETDWDKEKQRLKAALRRAAG